MNIFAEMYQMIMWAAQIRESEEELAMAELHRPADDYEGFGFNYEWNQEVKDEKNAFRGNLKYMATEGAFNDETVVYMAKLV